MAFNSDITTTVKLKMREMAAEMPTVAWVKMYETIAALDLLPDRSPALEQRGGAQISKLGAFTAHVCEAPGAFICATNHFVRTQRSNWNWEWMANSLNPYHEANDQMAMIDDDVLIARTEPHWCWGADGTGDVRRHDNIRRLWGEARARAARVRAPGAIMVTADGSVDTSMDPNRQETITASLHYCELVAALGMLARGGSFVWKLFTTYEHPSICCLYLMGCLFQKLYVYKPSTSKPANSEVYAVGKGFKGIEPRVLEGLLGFAGEDIFSQRYDDACAPARSAACNACNVHHAHGMPAGEGRGRILLGYGMHR